MLKSLTTEVELIRIIITNINKTAKRIILFAEIAHLTQRFLPAVLDNTETTI